MSSAPSYLSQRTQPRLQASSRVPHHSNISFLTGLYAKTIKTKVAIRNLLHKDRVMIRFKDAVLWNLLGEEEDEGGIPIKRKAIASDLQNCLIYRSDYYLVAENLQMFLFEAMAIPAEKKRKTLGNDSGGSTSYGTLLRSEEIRKVTEPGFHDVKSSFTESSQNPILASHVQEPTSSGPSTVSNYSEDTSSEQSTRSPISSRSSSCTRQNSQIEPLTHVLPYVPLKTNIQTSSGVINQQGLNKLVGDPSSLDICPLANDYASPALVSANDNIQTNNVQEVRCRDIGSIQTSNDDNYLVGHQSLSETPGAPNNMNPATSNMNRDLSIDGHSSSQSRSSSVTSNTQVQADAVKVRRHSQLESWIKDIVMRSDPEVAELVYTKAKDQLEYVTPEDIEEPEGTHTLSLLRLMELETFDLVQARKEVTTYTATSSSGQSPSTTMSTFDQSVVQSSSSTGQRCPTKETLLPEGGMSQQTKSQKSNTKSTIPDSPKARRFRCFHNALYPAIFCANQKTTEKFRTCAGPGWRKMQHCQEHMYKYHSKQVKKPKPLQCSVCLEEFLDIEELRSHTEVVDCPPRCLECNEEFSSKSLRLQHQKLSHFEEDAEGPYMELDEKKKKEIKEALKAFKSYSEQLKKRRRDPKPDLEDWIKANTVLYENGRSDEAKAKTRMELGYWYTIYKTLAPQTKILDHPFYDATTIPHADMASEKILLANDLVVQSKIEIHGPPPTDPDRQREWYRDSLRDALQIAARTTRKVTYTQPSIFATSTNMTHSTQSPFPNSRRRSLTPNFDLFGNGESTVAPSPNISNSFSEMDVSPESYVTNVQTMSTMTRGPNSLPESSLIEIGMGMNQDWVYNSDDLTTSNGQYPMDEIDPRYLDLGNSLPDQFGTSGSNITGNQSYRPRWPARGGQNGQY